MEDRDKIIIAIICGVIAIVLIIIIICFIFWFIIRRQKLKFENKKRSSSISHRPQYQRSQKLTSTNFIKNKKKRRFNTNDSAFSLPFNAPHLINQNVKNLDKLLATESTLTAKSWHYEEIVPTTNYFDRYYPNPATEPIYTSSLSPGTRPMSSLTSALQSYSYVNPLQFHFLNELDHVLHLKQVERPKNPIRYSQSCRQTNDHLPFDYYRPMTPSSMTGTMSSNEDLLDPTYHRTTRYSNSTLMRKARLAQLRDDTAILY